MIFIIRDKFTTDYQEIVTGVEDVWKNDLSSWRDQQFTAQDQFKRKGHGLMQLGTALVFIIIKSHQVQNHYLGKFLNLYRFAGSHKPSLKKHQQTLIF